MQTINLSPQLLKYAESIIDENDKILNPTIYSKHRIAHPPLNRQLKHLLATDKIDYVLFSSKSGAEPHIDSHLKHFENHTYIIPVILPKGINTLFTEEEDYELQVGNVYKINHQKLHSLEVANESGCVVIMASRIALKD